MLQSRVVTRRTKRGAPGYGPGGRNEGQEGRASLAQTLAAHDQRRSCPADASEFFHSITRADNAPPRLWRCAEQSDAIKSALR